MYVPLGGKRWRLIIAWPIFVFVGIWHDLELRWVAWSLFLSPSLCLSVPPSLPPSLPSLLVLRAHTQHTVGQRAFMFVLGVSSGVSSPETRKLSAKAKQADATRWVWVWVWVWAWVWA